MIRRPKLSKIEVVAPKEEEKRSDIILMSLIASRIFAS